MSIIALQLTSGRHVVARLRARHLLNGPLAAERGRYADGRCGIAFELDQIIRRPAAYGERRAQVRS